MASARDNALVLVTGASGYLATHVIKQLIASGFRVRGTVRSLQNEQKCKPIRDLGTEDNPIELVEADLNDEASWIPAVKGCQFVEHVASPFPKDTPNHEDELIKPAVNGVLSVFKACAEDGGIKRVVLTSSVAAVNAGFLARDKPWDESDFTDTSKLTGLSDSYIKSKCLAEKAAWDFVKDLQEDKKFELVVINPGYIMGPPISGTPSTSTEIPKQMLLREMPALPKVGLGAVDVRDVAQAHVNALTIPEVVGHRHILVNESLWFKDIAAILDEEFRPQGYNVPTRELPDFMVKFASVFRKPLRQIVPGLGALAKFDNGRMRSVLGIQGRDTKGTILDMAYAMIERGEVKEMSGYKGPKYSENV